jgi:hypothetical protein
MDQVRYEANSRHRQKYLIYQRDRHRLSEITVETNSITERTAGFLRRSR